MKTLHYVELTKRPKGLAKAGQWRLPLQRQSKASAMSDRLNPMSDRRDILRGLTQGRRGVRQHRPRAAAQAAPQVFRNWLRIANVDSHGITRS